MSLVSCLKARLINDPKTSRSLKCKTVILDYFSLTQFHSLDGNHVISKTLKLKLTGKLKTKLKLKIKVGKASTEDIYSMLTYVFFKKKSLSLCSFDKNAERHCEFLK